MSVMEITLLLIGVVIFVISFIIPEKHDKKSDKEIAVEKEEIHKLVESELSDMKATVNDATNETVEYAMEKAERSLEKVSNEKIMAVNEYATMLLDEINKNHQEVMFLYDMLQDKHTNLTNTVRKADATAREIETLSQTIEVEKIARRGLTDEQKAIFDELSDDSVTSSTQSSDATYDAYTHENAQFDPLVGIVIKDEDYIGSDSERSSDVSTEETDKSQAAANNNERILELHEQGYTTVEIAQELKLGVGEVKLVIDLFK